MNRPYDIASMLEESKRYVEIENLIKEIENDIFNLMHKNIKFPRNKPFKILKR